MTRNSKIDLPSYFQRIGYTGEQRASIETLQHLHRLHCQTFAFENINPFLGIPVNLDIEFLQQKLIYEGRGGYCFEQNLLFKYVLETLGFSVKGLAARVLWNKPQGEITQRSHMLLLIDYDTTKYIADVGFGSMTPTGPVLLESEKVQETPHEPFRLIKHIEEYYLLETLIQNEWKTLYRFDLEEQFLPDYEMANWYISNHPKSIFVTELIAARPAIDCRYTLHNNLFKVHHLNGNTESRTLATASELKNVLQNEFQLRLSSSTGVDAIFKKMTAPKRSDLHFF